MLYEVSLTKDAERDLEEIYLYIAERDSRVALTTFSVGSLRQQARSERLLTAVLTQTSCALLVSRNFDKFSLCPTVLSTAFTRNK
jgi:hypothetical protein